VLALSLVGDGLSDALNPHIRQRREAAGIPGSPALARPGRWTDFTSPSS
jgi:hypothetical protein